VTLEITFGSLLLVALWELCRPRRRREFPALRRRLGNLGIWLFNIITAALIFQPSQRFRFWPESPVGFVAGFLALDLLYYGVHRAQHAVPFLWRFHALHHSDPDVDVTTSVRHHPVEFLIATGCFWLAVMGLGVPGPVVEAHAVTVFTLAAATHGNVRWPAWAERLLHPALITLDLHLVHHSIATDEANANFGAVFSIWDRLFGTLAQPLSGAPVFGVADLSRADACRPLPMLLTPWRLLR
jgi:sterol desaturase/sphingolipid hydroxylase (fatty acid hydroxylase superfamily)